MNRISLGYSHKNVPVPCENEYTLTLLEKTEERFKSMKCIVTNKYASRVLEYNYTNSQKYARDILIPTIL